MVDFEGVHPGFSTLFYELRSRLLDIGGKEVVPDVALDEMIGEILNRGQIFQCSKSRPGRDSWCYWNAAVGWLRGEWDEIAIGYALSADGLWRRHAWGIGATGATETTQERTTYYGIKLSRLEVLAFCEAEAPDELDEHLIKVLGADRLLEVGQHL